MNSGQAVLGNVRFARGSAMRASDCITWPVRSAEPADAFEAVKHEYRITNQQMVVREADSVVTPLLMTTMNTRYRGPRGRLLTFKKSR